LTAGSSRSRNRAKGPVNDGDVYKKEPDPDGNHGSGDSSRNTSPGAAERKDNCDTGGPRLFIELGLDLKKNAPGRRIERGENKGESGVYAYSFFSRGRKEKKPGNAEQTEGRRWRPDKPFRRSCCAAGKEGGRKTNLQIHRNGIIQPQSTATKGKVEEQAPRSIGAGLSKARPPSRKSGHRPDIGGREDQNLGREGNHPKSGQETWREGHEHA